MADLIADLYRQNEWANLRLLEVCRTLTDEQLDATASGAYGSVLATLLHFAQDGAYVRALGGTYDGPDIDEHAPFPGFDALEEAFRATARGLLERARAVQDTGSFEVRSGSGTRSADAEVLLVQAINHATEHRSQVCTILTALGLTPPEIDAWAWGRADGRNRVLEGAP